MAGGLTFDPRDEGNLPPGGDAYRVGNLIGRLLTFQNPLSALTEETPRQKFVREERERLRRAQEADLKTAEEAALTSKQRREAEAASRPSLLRQQEAEAQLKEADVEDIGLNRRSKTAATRLTEAQATSAERSQALRDAIQGSAVDALQGAPDAVIDVMSGHLLPLASVAQREVDRIEDPAQRQRVSEDLMAATKAIGESVFARYKAQTGLAAMGEGQPPDLMTMVTEAVKSNPVTKILYEKALDEGGLPNELFNRRQEELRTVGLVAGRAASVLDVGQKAASSVAESSEKFMVDLYTANIPAAMRTDAVLADHDRLVRSLQSLDSQIASAAPEIATLRQMAASTDPESAALATQALVELTASQEAARAARDRISLQIDDRSKTLRMDLSRLSLGNTDAVQGDPPPRSDGPSGKILVDYMPPQEAEQAAMALRQQIEAGTGQQGVSIILSDVLSRYELRPGSTPDDAILAIATAAGDPGLVGEIRAALGGSAPPPTVRQRTAQAAPGGVALPPDAVLPGPASMEASRGRLGTGLLGRLADQIPRPTGGGYQGGIPVAPIRTRSGRSPNDPRATGTEQE